MKSFANWDIYYLFEYAVSFQLHGDGIPMLIYYEDRACRFCYVVMKKDIAQDPRFTKILEPNKYYDLETPYGYGGPLCEDIIPEASQKSFVKHFEEYSRNNGIVSQFIRFHPLLLNYNAMPLVFESRYLHQTIFIDTASPELIMNNMDSKNRNMVRKAIKNGVTIERKPIEEYRDFLPIYEETMIKDNADDYYFFKEEYFKEQLKLSDNACIFYAIKDQQPIAGAIMYYNDRFMHYHLAGTHTEFRQYSPSNLLLYQAACWASEKRIKRFHLGGGIVEDDNLFGFKKQFNKEGRLPFHIGRTIFDKYVYEQLVKLRSTTDADFNTDNTRMIQYRG